MGYNNNSSSYQIPSFLYSTILLLLFFILWFSSHNHHLRHQIFFWSTISSALSNHNHQNDSLYDIEESLARARDAINKAARSGNRFEGYKDDKGFIPSGPIYRNPKAFYQSYIEMEKRFKIWVYKEWDESPLFHQSSAKSAYAIEGQFIDELEKGNSKFLARHPDEAVTFFLPIGVTYIVLLLNRPGHYDYNVIPTVLMDYINVVSNKYPFWNRSNGHDHFFVGCHDWSPQISRHKSQVFQNLIRVICNANTSEGFDPVRDATLPEIKILGPELGPPFLSEDHDPKNRTILAFFAGGPHGYVRNRLHEYWKDKDKDNTGNQIYIGRDINGEVSGIAEECVSSPTPFHSSSTCSAI
ncbi:OLC1v1021947C1 [Oldenlandia corymbosa var. corymbosa]|uniref:OLC1v1021947C1 n=1 Tax=Oldenlandia corymbosa var. corymbosa TaxID=529605 RepID=A0AAV1BZI7_OLDCO|nr:OLC1v1021947C1 [Oldenlandia corymbosa var. corymbosa]